MKPLYVVLLVLFGLGLLFVLHEHAQNGRYQPFAGTPSFLDTRTGEAWRMSLDPTTTVPTLICQPISEVRQKGTK